MFRSKFLSVGGRLFKVGDFARSFVESVFFFQKVNLRLININETSTRC